MLPWFDPTSKHLIHSSEGANKLSDGALLALNREFKNILNRFFVFTSKGAY